MLVETLESFVHYVKTEKNKDENGKETTLKYLYGSPKTGIVKYSYINEIDYTKIFLEENQHYYDVKHPKPEDFSFGLYKYTLYDEAKKYCAEFLGKYKTSFNIKENHNDYPNMLATTGNFFKNPVFKIDVETLKVGGDIEKLKEMLFMYKLLK